MSDVTEFQARIDALAYPPTHTYRLDGLEPMGVLAERWELLQRLASEFWNGKGTFLDVGANKGFFSLKASFHGFLVDGIESDPALRQLCVELGINTYQDTFRSFAPPVAKYDRVFMGNVHHYAYRESGWDFVRKLAAVTKPGGSVLIEGPLGNECVDVQKCLSPEALAGFTRGDFQAAVEPWFHLVVTEPTVAYTPDRYLVLLQRRLARTVSVSITDFDEKPIWRNEANKSEVHDFGGDVIKTYEDPPASLARSLAFAQVSSFTNGIVAEAWSRKLVGWVEKRIVTEKRFERGQADRHDDSRDINYLWEIFRTWCRYNAQLARMGMVDVDPGPANWFRAEDGRLLTFDKNAIRPIGTLDLDETDPLSGRFVRTFRWAYPPEFWQTGEEIAMTLWTKNSQAIEEAFEKGALSGTPFTGGTPSGGTLVYDIEPYKAALEREIGAEDTVLDLGAGTRWLQAYFPATTQVVSVDGFAKDLLSSERVRGPLIIADVIDAASMFREDFFDVVTILDVLEHFDEPRAVFLLAEAMRLARKVVVFTPDGEYPQEGTKENPLQAHRSTWCREDLEAFGFVVETWPNFHKGLGHGGALFAVWTRPEAK